MTTYNPGENTQDSVTLSRGGDVGIIKKKMRVLKRRKKTLNRQMWAERRVASDSKWQENIKGLEETRETFID